MVAKKNQGGFIMSQNNYRKNNSKSEAYVYGNTVRKLSVAMPVTKPQKRDKADDDQEKREQRQHHKEMEKAHKINFLYTVAVVGVLAFIFTVCVQYLELQAAVKSDSAEVSKLELQLSKLTDQNDMTELEANSSIDYDAIKATAMNELGMVYPNKSQVIDYTSKESEYVEMYGKKIPAVK